jgi:ferredoxin
MCEWCIKYGHGRKWFEYVGNYAKELYKEKERKKFSRDFAVDMEKMIAVDLKKALSAKDKKFWPAIKEEIERFSRKFHLGQVVTLKEAELILKIANPIGRMACPCRRVTRGIENARYCLGFGVGMYKWESWPDFYRGGVEFLSPEEAIEFVREMNKLGLVHSIWTFVTPFIGGFCNCEYPSCLGMRSRMDYGVKNLLKSHYIARVIPEKCRGKCRGAFCVPRCQFGAITYSPTMQKAIINPWKCFGCGLCETSCRSRAIELIPRENFPRLKNEW